MDIPLYIENMRYKCSYIDEFKDLIDYIESPEFGLFSSKSAEFFLDHFNKTLDNKEYIKIKLFELYNYDCNIIIWNKGSESKIHDHAINGCIYKILGGELVEQRYNKEFLYTSSNTLKLGDIGYISNDMGYHKMVNPNKDKYALSLHFYSPANYIVNTYS